MLKVNGEYRPLLQDGDRCMREKQKARRGSLVRGAQDEARAGVAMRMLGRWGYMPRGSIIAHALVPPPREICLRGTAYPSEYFVSVCSNSVMVRGRCPYLSSRADLATSSRALKAKGSAQD